jgi:ribonuclease HI
MMSREDLQPAIKALKAMAVAQQNTTTVSNAEMRASCLAALAILEGPIAVGNQTYVMEFDGASKGNPGPAGVGVVIYDPSGAIVEKLGQALPESTNNVAEYKAFITGLKLARKLGIKNLSIRTDSELVAKQISGEYKIRKPELAELAAQVNSLLREFESYTIKHIPRELNVLADKLASSAIKIKAAKEKQK